MSRILLFLSTGRCGTQFLTDMLAQAAQSRATVVHEPLRSGYWPRQCLRMADPVAKLHEFPAIAEHFAGWDAALAEGRGVVETGWPIFPWLPYLAERFAGRIEIVHLLRDPIRTAFSMASHRYYSDRRDDDFTREAVLTPEDPGVRWVEYRALWPNLNPVERCLFFWAEVHGLAEEMAAAGQIALQMRAEDLFAKPMSAVGQLRGMHPFWNATFADPIEAKPLVDRFQFGIETQIRGVRCARSVAEIAHRCGYRIDLEGQRDALVARFFSPDTPRA